MEKHPLHIKDPEFQISKEVQEAVEKKQRLASVRNKELMKSDAEGPLEPEKVPNDPSARIEAYTDRLENIFLNKDERVRERNMEMLRDKVYDTFIIKPDIAAEQILKNEAKVALDRGYGRIEITDEMKNRPETLEQAKAVIQRQKESLDQWIDYLTGNDATSYDPWFKYYLWTSITKLQILQKIERVDENTGEKIITAEYPKRTASTLKPFPDLFRGKLAQIYDKYNAYISGEKTDAVAKQYFQKNFAKLYAEESLDHVLNSSIESKKETRGAWIKYEKGNDEDAERMTLSLQMKYTDWCIDGEAVGKDKINEGDIYIYYTFDISGNPVDPRLCIRMNGDHIAEVRGISGGKSQEIEQVFMDETSEGGSVLGKKLKEFGNEADTYKKREGDMKYVTRLMKKMQNNDSFTKEDLIFLYEFDSNIESFGYYSDPRIEELKLGRDVKSDISLITGYSKDEISITEEEALNGKSRFHYGDLDLTSLTSAEGLTLPKEIVGNLHFQNLTSAKGLILPEKIEGNLYLPHITSAEGLIFPEKIGGFLNLPSLNSAKGLILPKEIGSYLNLSNFTSIEGLILPEKIGGSLYLPHITSAKGLTLPDKIGSHLDLSNLTSAKGLILPKEIGGNLDLISLTSATGLTLPEKIGGHLDLSFLTSTKGLTFPLKIGRNLYLTNLISARELILPKEIGGDLNLPNFFSAKRLILPEKIGGSLHLPYLTSSKGLTLPKEIGSYLDLSRLNSVKGLIFPKKVGGYINLSNLTSAKGLILPEKIGNFLNLTSLTSAEGLTLPKEIGGDLDLSDLTSAKGLILPEKIEGHLIFISLTFTERERLRREFPHLTDKIR